MASYYKYTHFLLIIFVFLLSKTTMAQAFSGLVEDAETKEALPFVNISFNGETMQGTSTDINGIFQVPETVKLDFLVFSYLGYNQDTISLSEVDLSQNPVVFPLTPMAFKLEEVVINPGKNPADIIMEKVIANRDNNDPAKLGSYSLNTYNKTLYDLLPSNEVNELLQRQVDTIDVAIDKDEKKNRFLNAALKLSGDRHVMVLESVTEKIYKSPDKIQERIIANKVSGFKDPSFAPIPANFQPFSFYSDFIQILDHEYENPVSKGSTKRYFFNIEDTILTQQTDTVFVLSFKPKRKKNFKALKGVIYVNTNGYALQNIMAEPNDQGTVYAKLQQQCKQVEGGQWFPSEINFEVVFENVPSKNVGMKLTGKSYIRDVKINPPLSDDQFGIEQMTIDELAAKKDNAFWIENREDTLSIKEQKTYYEMEKMGKKLKLDYWMKISSKLVDGYLPVGFWDVQLSKIFQMNQIEGTRFGFGGQTNEVISERFNVGGFVGYGLRDRILKYGGHLQLNLQKENEVSLKMEYEKENRIAGQSALEFPINVLDVRNFLVANFDQIEQARVSLNFRTMRYAKVKAYFSRARHTPTYDYSFFDDCADSNNPDCEPTAISNFNFAEIGLKVRYAYKERIVQSFGRRVSRGTKYPTLFLAYSHGFDGVLGGKFDYNRLELGFDQGIRIKGLGKSWLRVEGGFVDRPVPYSKLFLSNGNFSPSVPVFVYYTFQTMRLFEFLNDRYVHFFWVHDFENLLLNTKNFKPEVKLVNAIGYGRLNNTELHDLNPDALFDTGFRTMEKGYFETGFVLNNLVRFNLMNVAYFGIGAGAFYRYGPYAYDNQLSNFAFKAAFYFSTN